MQYRSFRASEILEWDSFGLERDCVIAEYNFNIANIWSSISSSAAWKYDIHFMSISGLLLLHPLVRLNVILNECTFNLCMQQNLKNVKRLERLLLNSNISDPDLQEIVQNVTPACIPTVRCLWQYLPTWLGILEATSIGDFYWRKYSLSACCRSSIVSEATSTGGLPLVDLLIYILE